MSIIELDYLDIKIVTIENIIRLFFKCFEIIE